MSIAVFNSNQIQQWCLLNIRKNNNPKKPFFNKGKRNCRLKRIQRLVKEKIKPVQNLNLPGGRKKRNLGGKKSKTFAEKKTAPAKSFWFGKGKWNNFIILRPKRIPKKKFFKNPDTGIQEIRVQLRWSKSVFFIYWMNKPIRKPFNKDFKSGKPVAPSKESKRIKG